MNEILEKTGLALAKQIRRYLELGDLDRAEELCTEAMGEFGDDPDMLLQAGNVHYFRKRYAEAARHYRQVQTLRPGDSDVRTMLWGTYRDAGDFEKMLQLAQEFQEHPLNDNEFFFAYRTYIALCDWKRAAVIQERALKMLREGRISHGLISAMLIDLCSIPDLPPELVYEIHRLWGEDEAGKREPYFLADTPLPPVEGRLKIAYISADFNAHPVGAFMNQIIRSHDRSRFEIYCYAYLERNDAFTQNFRDHAEHFIDITAMRHDEVAKRIHDDGIHLLVELGGHTTNSRLAVLAYKPAPVQLTYLGYPNTTGLPTVDYRITDHLAESPEGTRYVEKLLKMPQSFLCYGTGLAQQPSDAAPATKTGQVTFASLNHIRKLTPETVRAWSTILNRVPGSRLLMKARAVESGSSLILENVLAEFERHGIERGRIEFLPFTDSHKEHMLQYNRIDVALDSFPYNGTTTTCDALIMGVPVVTLVGAAHAQRVSYSIMKNIGFEETVTHSVDDYVEKAVMLAGRPEYLTMLRQILPTLFRHSILCQSETFTRQMETLYLQAWQEKSGTSVGATQASAEQQPPEWIFINGMPRSGSTWCYNIARELCTRNGVGNIIGYAGEGSDLDRVLQSPPGDAATPRLIKFHSPTKLALEMLESGRARAVYSQRDPRDVVVSLMDFNSASFDHIYAGLPGLLQQHAMWKQTANVQGLEYREIMEQPASCIRQVAEWLGLECSEALAGEIADACSAESTRKQIEKVDQAVNNQEAAEIQKVSDSRYYDTGTLLHANHIRSGKIGRYRDRLNAKQVKKLDAFLQEWLIGEGYESGSASEPAAPPAAPGKSGKSASRAIRIENDLLITVPDDLNLMTPYILEEQQDWFEDEIKFTRHLIKPGMQIIDIGANYGCYALTMAKLAGPEGRLWAFEPCSATADHLEESIRANGLEQLQLIRAALSNRQGTATLSTQENAELNSLTSDNGGTGTETVPLYRLDDCMQEYGWRNIDFMKLDAEGEEIRILEGGADFFRDCSPLVMFELKHGATVNEGLIQAFRDMDYGIYKLIPGLNLLVPFDPTEEPDPFQLNLFGCKHDRAEQLQAAGLLCLGAEEGELEIGHADAWADHLKQSPYAVPLIEQWQAAESGLPGEAEYRTALNAYAMAQQAKGTPESYAWLRAAFIQLIMALEQHASLPRLLTLARIATDLGRRSAAAQALHQFVEVISHEQKFNPVEPFLAASARAAAIDPAGELANWCLAQALAERERLQAFSSYFTGSGSVSALNIIANLNYQDAEMDRRRELIARRFAQ